MEEVTQMRSRAVQLVQQPAGAGRRAYVLVNNRAEGNAPLTVQALTEMLNSPFLQCLLGYPPPPYFL